MKQYGMRRNQVGNKRESATARVIFDTKDLNDFAEKAHFSRSLLDLEVLSELIEKIEHRQDLVQLIGSVRRWFGKGLIAKNSDADQILKLIAGRLEVLDCQHLQRCFDLDDYIEPKSHMDLFVCDEDISEDVDGFGV